MIGEGTMGSVASVVDHTGKKFAVKKIIQFLFDLNKNTYISLTFFEFNLKFPINIIYENNVA